MIKRIIDRPQFYEMGTTGFGHIETSAETTLGDVLKWIEENEKTWGIVTIYRSNNDIIRCFDYDLYNRSIFYHHLNDCEYNFIIKEIKFDYCFISENIDIYVK